MPDDLELRKKRVLYRAQHRGTQEMDILLGGYVADNLATFDADTLDRLEALMNFEETDLQGWLMEQTTPPSNADHALLAAIRDHRLAQAAR